MYQLSFKACLLRDSDTLTPIIWLLSIENRDVTSAQRFGYSSILSSLTKIRSAASKSEYTYHPRIECFKYWI